ncbi:hypothetical protein, partial [Brevundimonas sp.]|uniref:hypothetical protein n=1 Tax=Brevundimonas sp. TaxID=1871086 RepID=UPI002ABC12E2
KSVAYINALMKAVRDAGCALPVFHNVTQDQRVAADIARSNMQGGTFAWYPTGLQGGHEIEGNHLLLVEQYDAMRDARLSGKARLVYEFDAADTMATYMLPAMARTFRAGGAQFAAYFTYDPLPIAAANLEFNDHFLNLAYTPGKAISLMIAAEVFRRWPRRQGFGAYPRSMRFGPFRVDDEADLSEMVTETEYLHSHDTATVPPAPERLERLAGVGSSPLVGYEGTGACFLDRLQSGEWRLEILADAAVIANPFDRRHPDRPVARVVHRPRIIEIALPDLGNDYAIEGTDGTATARAGQAIVRPGVYRLRRAGMVAAPAVLTAGVVQPVASPGPPLILFEPPRRLVAGQDWALRAQLIADRTLPVTVRLETASGETQVALTPGIGFDVAARVAGEGIRPGPLSGVIEAAGAQPVRFETTVVEASAGGLLFDAGLDQARMIVPYGGYQPFPQAVFVQDGRLGGAALRLNGEDLTADAHADLSVQFPVRPDWTRAEATALRLSARSAKGRDARLTVVLIERDGMAWGLPIALGQNGVEVALSSAVPVQAVMLPRDFPKGVNPPWFRRPGGRGGPQDRLDPAAIRAVQFVLAGRFFAQGDDTRPEVLIQRLEIV